MGMAVLTSSVAQTRYHHGDLRNALLKAAETLLVEKGAATLSLREVAKVAGVSHTAPYRHFKGKAELLQALAQSGFEQLKQALQVSTANAVRDPVQKMIEAGVAYVRQVVRNPEVTRLMFGSMVTVKCSGEHSAASDVAMNTLVPIIEEGIKALGIEVEFAALHRFGVQQLEGLPAQARLHLEAELRRDLLELGPPQRHRLRRPGLRGPPPGVLGGQDSYGVSIHITNIALFVIYVQHKEGEPSPRWMLPA